MKKLNRYLLIIAAFILIGMKTQAQTGEMKNYTFVMLKKGTHRDQDSVTVAKIQEAHLKHIGEMADSGMLNIAGPFLDNSDWRGIFIFNTSDTLVVRKLVEADPAIISGRLTFEMHPWYSQKGASLK